MHCMHAHVGVGHLSIAASVSKDKAVETHVHVVVDWPDRAYVSGQLHE